MTNCAKCGRVLTSANTDRDNNGVVRWCVMCPKAEHYMWDNFTVGSQTDWTGGRVPKGGADDTDGEGMYVPLQAAEQE